MNIDNLITQYEQRAKNLHNSLRMAKGVAKARVSDKLYCANKTLDELNTLRLYVVSQQRGLLEAYTKQIKEDNEFTEEITFQDINKCITSNCG